MEVALKESDFSLKLFYYRIYQSTFAEEDTVRYESIDGDSVVDRDTM